jgi:tRNA threonylcarbamoyladenosine biosynthesis protein TsaE
VARTVITRSEHETAAIGRALADLLEPGAVVLLSGDLGTGKTAFVRGLAQGLGVDPDEVSSPTFTLVQEYRGGRLPLYHVDLYRVQSAEVDDLGLDDLALEGGIIAIEWPDRLPRPFADAVEVRIEQSEDETRTVRLAGEPHPPVP